MKVYKILLFFLFAGGILLASPSCSREELNIRPEEEQERYPVSLSLSVAELEAGTPETKAAVVDPDLDDNLTTTRQIYCFTVLQFEKTGDGGVLRGRESYEGPQVAPILNGSEQIKVLYSKGNQAFVFVVVANTLNVYGNVNSTTLEDFTKHYSELTGYDQAFLRIDGKDYLRMSGSAEFDHVDQGTVLDVNLIRNVSKITVNVTNATDGDGKVALEKVQLRDINAKYYYRTPLDGNKEPAYEDPYSANRPCRFDKEQEDFPADGNNGAVQTFTYYVPANLRGVTNSEFQYTKGQDAPEGATRFCMYGTYGDDNTPVNYTYYLGGDLVKDFNLKPNHHYTYNITLKDKGNARFDYRVEDLEEVKFHVDANSYMVHPPKVEGQSRVYAIPIRRAATFWNKEGENGGIYGASRWEKKDYSAFSITPDTEWTAEVIGDDFGMTEDQKNEFLFKRSGTGFDPTQPTQDPYFKIRVKAGMKGNAQIAVKVGDNIVWSWHIWITDYDPDQKTLIPRQGQYFYDVEGGQVHRYNNVFFNTTEPTETTDGYKNGFIMDRNLGALGISFEDQSRSMYYQFGRKDPFWMNDSRSKVELTKTGEPILSINTLSVPQNVRYGVCHPKAFISASNQPSGNGWTSNRDEDDLAGPGEGWFDRKYYQHIGNQEVLEIKKSIYDPCPPGWKIPNSNFASGIYIPNKSIVVTESTNVEFTENGFNYWPEGKTNKDKTGTVFLPALDFINGNGNLNVEKKRCRLWTNRGYISTSSDPVTRISQQTASYYLGIMTEVSMSSVGQIHAYPVRCVREYGAVNK